MRRLIHPVVIFVCTNYNFASISSVILIEYGTSYIVAQLRERRPFLTISLTNFLLYCIHLKILSFIKYMYVQWIQLCKSNDWFYFLFLTNSLNNSSLLKNFESINNLTLCQMFAWLCSISQYRGIRKHRTGVTDTILRLYIFSPNKQTLHYSITKAR